MFLTLVKPPPPDSAQKGLHQEEHPPLLPWVLEVMYLTLVLPPPPDPAQGGLHQEEHTPLLPWVLEVLYLTLVLPREVFIRRHILHSFLGY
jgi:hypothetical protein